MNQEITGKEGKFVYGLDISLKNTGVAVYDLEKMEFVFVGSFSTEKIRATKIYKGLEVNALKLGKLAGWFMAIVKEYPPSDAGIERMFVKYKNETIVIAKATGVIQHCIWDIPQVLYPPKSVKLAIWHGDASKDEVKDEILKRYPDLIMNNEDESDAVAVCLCHLVEKGHITWEKAPKPAPKKRKKKE